MFCLHVLHVTCQLLICLLRWAPFLFQRGSWGGRVKIWQCDCWGLQLFTWFFTCGFWATGFLFVDNAYVLLVKCCYCCFITCGLILVWCVFFICRSFTSVFDMWFSNLWMFYFWVFWLVDRPPLFSCEIFTCRFDWFFTCGCFYLLVFYLWIVPIFTSEYFICVFFSCGSLLGFATEPQLVICKVHSSKLNVATST